jgi:integrase
MLKQAARWQLIARNPAADLELPSVPKSEMVTLTREQAGRLLKVAERRPLMRLLVMLGVASGARLGELPALCWTDVDLDAGTVRIGWSRRFVKRRVEVKGPRPKRATGQ